LVEAGGTATKSLKSIREVAEMLEETINRVRQGKIDLRASNAIGFLSGILLKALEKGPIEERLKHIEAILGGKTRSPCLHSANETRNKMSNQQYCPYRGGG
jgi:hypothetical protein